MVPCMLLRTTMMALELSAPVLMLACLWAAASWACLATKGQSAAVAAQYMLSGQQNQLASGQHPAGHEVSPDPHCLPMAIFMSWAFLATKGQSAAVAAQYMLSGQQNQLASGQQPA